MKFRPSLNAAPNVLFLLPGALSLFPPPLRGRVRVGGAPREVGVRGTPTPAPSPQGGGKRTFRVVNTVGREAKVD
jgi:hypothetical protein